MSDRKKAIVTGASSGIGRATAARFAADGYDVCLIARREHLLRQLAEQLPAGDHLVCPADYSDPAAMEAIAQKLRDRWGRVEALVNSAGISDHVQPIETPLDQWWRCVATMLRGALLVTRVAVPLMSQGGRIIFITSIHGERAEAGSSSYGVAKAALNQLCRALALELADRGILVNAIAPGFVRAPMCIRPDGTNELETDWFRQNYVEGHHLPLRRPGEPEEIAGVAAFLAGPDASYITGQVITVDGGLTITF